MSESDFYGDQNNWFIGVVKDTNDPMNSNYVRVRIKGVHPEAGDDSSTTPGSGSLGGTTTPGSGSGGSSGSIGNAGPAAAPITPDKASLPTQAQLDGKISKNFTLRQLTVGASGPQSRRTCQMGISQGKLTADIIYNLANLSVNCLDKIKQDHQNLNINSGWRIGVSPADRGASGGNHPKGYAADISCPGVSPRELANYCNTNLRGRFNMLLIYPTFIHIQLGGSSNQGSLSNPLIRNN
jgi:hypothetical protein